MTDRPDHRLDNPLPLELLRQRWDEIEKHALQIADEVDIKSEGVSGNFAAQTLAIAHFFRHNGDYQQALNKPCVLAVANPLARMAAGGEISRSDVTTAVQTGLCTLARHGSNHRTLFRLFLYPILLTYFVVIGYLLVAHFLLGTFEQMYAEFGVMLPLLTRFFLSLGHLCRHYSMSILLVLFGLPPLIGLLNWIGHENREPGMSRFDVMLARKRPTVARWLLHVSLLLEAGLTKKDAIEKAAAISNKRWLRKLSASRGSLRGRFGESPPADPPESASDSAQHFFDPPSLHMANTALAAPRSRGQVTLMQHVATWYRDSSSNIIEWLVQLLIPLYVFLVLLGCVLLVISLLAPIFGIIQGLAGGGPGGFM